MIEKIKALIQDTEKWHNIHTQKRDRYPVGTGKRHVGSIDAAACRIRLKALEECLRIAENEES